MIHITRSLSLERRREAAVFFFAQVQMIQSFFSRKSGEYDGTVEVDGTANLYRWGVTRQTEAYPSKLSKEHTL